MFLVSVGEHNWEICCGALEAPADPPWGLNTEAVSPPQAPSITQRPSIRAPSPPGERMNERLNERLNEREGSSSHVIRQLLSAVWDLNSGEFFCFLFSNSFIRLGASKTLKAMVRFSGTGDWLAFSWRCWQAWSFRWPVVSLCSCGLLSKGPFLSCSRFVLILPEQFSSCYDSWRGLQGNKAADRWNWIDQHFRR